MDSKGRRELEECVLRILRHGDMNMMTESKVRKLAGEETGFDLTDPANRKIVKRVVEDFFVKIQAAPEEKVQTKVASRKPPAKQTSPKVRRRRNFIDAGEDEDEEEEEVRAVSKPPKLPQAIVRNHKPPQAPAGNRRRRVDIVETDDEEDEEEPVKNAKKVMIDVGDSEVSEEERQSRDKYSKKQSKRQANDSEESEEERQSRDKYSKKQSKRQANDSGESEEEGQSRNKYSKKQPKRQANDSEESEEERQSRDKYPQAKRPTNDDGDAIICQLSKTRTVAVQEFKGKMLISIREHYEKDGKLLPSKKGISLTAEQWEAFKKGIPAIEAAIKRLKR